LTSKIDNMTSKLDRLFGSKTRMKILRELFLKAAGEYHLRELSKKLNIPYGALYREVKNLSEIGVIRCRRQGKMVLVSANRELPYYQELRGILLKGSAVIDILKEKIREMGKVKLALIYGSYARGEADEYSDIDLLIVGSTDEEKLAMEMDALEREIGREINYILWDEGEFKRRLKERHHLLMEIIRNPTIILVGETDELRRIVEAETDREN